MTDGPEVKKKKKIGSGNQAKKQDGNERPGRGKYQERTPEL